MGGASEREGRGSPILDLAAVTAVGSARISNT